MALSQTVEISANLLAAPMEVQKRALALQGQKLNTQIARGVQQVFMAHFFELDRTRANDLGGKRTHFYGDAAKATSSQGTETEAIVTVAQQGIRQRLEGGTIRAKPGGWLTIPARAEAYGRRAREFHDLHFIKLKNGNAMLVAGELTGATGRMDKKGNLQTRAGSEEGVVMYWLVPEVYQAPDASVLPKAIDIEAVVVKTVDAAWGRKEGGKS